MIHSDVACEACGSRFTYESQRKKPRRFCSDKCLQSNRILTPEQKAAKVERIRLWRKENEQLNREQRRNFYLANRERLIEATREWGLANPEKLEAANRRIREDRKKNPLPYLQRERDRYVANREAILARRRERYESEPEYRSNAIQSIRDWREKYPERSWQKSLWDAHIRRARLLGADIEAEKFTRAQVFEACGWVCHICERRVSKHGKYPDPWSASLDHIVPLSRGGSHARSNVALAHLRCNLAKGNRETA